jgi:hypothetical protein
VHDLRPAKKKEKKNRKKRKAGWFYSRVREKKRQSFGGRKLRPKTERGERKMGFSHSHFRQRLEDRLWSDLDEISVCCS